MRIDWINPQSRRYYTAELVTNLWGQHELVRAWGGIGSHRGGQSSQPDPDPEALNRLAKRRASRGYQCISDRPLLAPAPVCQV